jgi:hypothetical protein
MDEHVAGRFLIDTAHRAKAILGARLIGFYVYGSYATGDWFLARSDLDFLGVLDRAPTRKQRRALADLGEQLRNTDLGRRLRGEYLPLANVHPPVFPAFLLESFVRDARAVLGPPVARLSIAVPDRAVVDADEVARIEAHGATIRAFFDAPDETRRVMAGVEIDALLGALRSRHKLETGVGHTKREAIDAYRPLLGDDLAEALHAYRRGDLVTFALDEERVRAVLAAWSTARR